LHFLFRCVYVMCLFSTIADRHCTWLGRRNPSLKLSTFCTSLVHPEATAFGADLHFTADVYFLFIPMRDLQAPSANWHEILHDDQ